MHMKPGHEEEFHLAASFVSSWIALAFVRVGVSLERCRVFTIYFGCWMLASALCWHIDPLRELGVPAIMAPLSAITFVYLVPRQYDVPINIEYHVAKFTGAKMLLLGQPIVALVISPSPDMNPNGIYTLAFFSLVLVLSIKLLIFDCNVVAIKDHAIRQSRGAALLWLHLCEPSLGIGGLMAAKNKSETPEADGHARLIFLAVSGLVATLVLAQSLHRNVYSGNATMTSTTAVTMLVGSGVLAAEAFSKPGVDTAVLAPCAVCAALVLVILVDRARAQAPDTTEKSSDKDSSKTK